MRGERSLGAGVGAVLLKRLEDARVDGDFIHGIILSSAVNNDGSLKVGFTAPGVDGQAKVVATAHALAGIDADTVTYVETHGTGTVLGDPIEVAALTKAFRTTTDRDGFCGIGSVKSNFGHLDSAAGIAGLIKTLLALRHKMLPPSLHFEQTNPQIDFASSPFYVNSRLRDWVTSGAPRRAGVSSFGFGGTNAHIVLEEAPAPKVAPSRRAWQLLVLSAKTEKALEATAANLAAHLRQDPDLKLADVAHTLQVGRGVFDHRRTLVCASVSDAIATLEGSASKSPESLCGRGGRSLVAFMFPGQGAQHINMARELYRGETTFRAHVDQCCEQLTLHLGLDLKTLIYPDHGDSKSAADSLKQTAVAQPALFVIEYAMARLWMEWGVLPEAMIGHSIGEYVAAHLAGVFSLEHALFLVAERGRLMQQLPPGAMLAVPLSPENLRPELGAELSIAAVNSPGSCVVSGQLEAIELLEARLGQLGTVSHRLHTSHAFHSPMVEPVLDTFTQVVRGVGLHAPEVPYVSNVTGTWITAAEATDPEYWARHMRETVRFAAGIEVLLEEPYRLLIEVGPGRGLTNVAGLHMAEGHVVVSSMRHARDKQSDVASLLQAVGKLWLNGVTPDWDAMCQGEGRRRVPLPTYPFERQRYWVEPDRQLACKTGKSTARGRRLDARDWFYVPTWKRVDRVCQFPREGARRWLVFIDSLGIGSQLAERLRAAGDEVATVIPNDRFVVLGDRAYAIDAGDPNDYRVLIKTLTPHGKGPDAVAHLWTLEPVRPVAPDPQGSDNAQHLGFYSLTFLSQALGERSSEVGIEISVITTGVQDVLGEEEHALRTRPSWDRARLSRCSIRTSHVAASTLFHPNVAVHSCGTRPSGCSKNCVHRPPRWSPIEQAVTAGCRNTTPCRLKPQPAHPRS